MKKTIACILLIAVLFLSVSPVSATNPDTKQTVITTTIQPSYTINIPADTPIVFNTLSSAIGNVGVSDCRLEVGKQVVITATGSNQLINSADVNKKIAYVLKSGNTVFTEAKFTANGTKPLTIDITQDAWNEATPGSYSDTITFTVSYTSQ